MKRLWALLLAGVFIFSCASVYAQEEAASGQRVDVKMQLNLEDEGMLRAYMDAGDGMYESTAPALQQLTKSLAALIQLMDIQILTDDENISLALNLNGKSLFDVRETVQPDGSVLLDSSLMPGIYFSISAQEEEENEQRSQELIRIVDEMLALLDEFAEEYIGQMGLDQLTAVAGEYTADGQAFPYKAEIAWDAQAFWALYQQYGGRWLTLAEEMLVQLGMPGDNKALEEAIADLEKEEMPKVLGSMKIRTEVYTTQDYTHTCIVYLIDIDELSFRLSVREDGEKTYIAFSVKEPSYEDNTVMEEAISLQLWVQNTEQGFLAEGEAVSLGTYTGYHVEMNRKSEQHFDFLYQTFPAKDAAPMCTLTVTGRPYEEPVPQVETDGKEALPVAALEAQYGDEHYSRLQTAVGMGINSLTVQAVVAAPQEIQALLNAVTAYENAVMEYIYNEWNWEEPTEMPQEDGVAF